MYALSLSSFSPKSHTVLKAFSRFFFIPIPLLTYVHVKCALRVLRTRVPIPSSHADAAASKWVDAVIWKFCDLDKHPHDR